MKEIFADTFYWVALLNPADSYHQRASMVGRNLIGARLVTTDEILIEVLTYFSGSGHEGRAYAAGWVQRLLVSESIAVLMQRRETFLDGLRLYQARPDKAYSGVDAISMVAMKARGITEILTHDHHFAQEGFVLLL